MTVKEASAISMAEWIAREAMDYPRSPAGRTKPDALQRVARRMAEELPENASPQDKADWLFKFDKAFPMNFKQNSPSAGKDLAKMTGGELLEHANAQFHDKPQKK